MWGFPWSAGFWSNFSARRLGPTFSLSQGPTFCRNIQVDLRVFFPGLGGHEKYQPFSGGKYPTWIDAVFLHASPIPLKNAYEAWVALPWNRWPPGGSGAHGFGVLFSILFLGWWVFFSRNEALLKKAWNFGLGSLETEKKPPRIFPLATQEDHPKFLVKHVERFFVSAKFNKC